MNPRSQAPQPSSTTSELNRRSLANVQALSTQTKPSNTVSFAPSTSSGMATYPGRTVNVRAVGRPDFRPTTAGKNTGVGRLSTFSSLVYSNSIFMCIVPIFHSSYSKYYDIKLLKLMLDVFCTYNAIY